MLYHRKALVGKEFDKAANIALRGGWEIDLNYRGHWSRIDDRWLLVDNISTSNQRLAIKHLSIKYVNISVTNACNLKCGGCTQHCDLFHKKEKWFIPIEQLKNNIEILLYPKGYRGLIGIFGGEPTIHPRFKEILELISFYYQQEFCIFTNGRKMCNLPQNVGWIVNSKDENSQRNFCASMMAPYDFYKFKNKIDYWNFARKECFMWKNCWSIIYDNKAYLCEPAAAIDRLKLGKRNWNKSKGWDLILGKNPFDKTEKEIAKQAENFCYRCGCCTHKYQNSSEKTIVTPTNYDLLNIKHLMI